MKSKPACQVSFQPRLRVLFGGIIAIGPGKAQLLRLVQEQGSISEAARRMNMSYMRAWSLIRTMNACFCEPVVATSRGGRTRGGAQLTATGRRILALYERLEAQCQQSMKTARRSVSQLLKSPA